MQAFVDLVDQHESAMVTSDPIKGKIATQIKLKVTVLEYHIYFVALRNFSILLNGKSINRVISLMIPTLSGENVERIRRYLFGEY